MLVLRKCCVYLGSLEFWSTIAELPMFPINGWMTLV